MTAPFTRALIFQTKHRIICSFSRYSYQTRTLASLRNSRDPRDLRGPRGSSGRPVVNRKLIEPAASTNQQTLPTTPNYSLENPSLLAPVHVPEDKNAILCSNHPAARLLENSALVVSRQLELMNVMLGYEQANKYTISDPQGNHIGFIAEEDSSVAKSITRQFLNTHRAFTTHIFDKHEKEVLRFHRPFSFINSRISVYDPLHETTYETISDKLADMRVVGEAQQEWHLWKRRYNLFLAHRPPTGIPTIESNETTASHVQFAYVDSGFLSWEFALKSEDEKLLGHVSRNWGGFGREILTDTGTYVLRMDAAAAEPGMEAPERGMTLDQRAVMLATAVCVDFDYFSRKSGNHGGLMPMGIYGGGGAAEAPVAGAGGAVVGGAGATGDVGVGAMGGMVGGATGGVSSTPDSAPPSAPAAEEDNWWDKPNDGKSVDDEDSWWNRPSDGSGSSGATPRGGGGGGGGDGGSWFDGWGE